MQTQPLTHSVSPAAGAGSPALGSSGMGFSLSSHPPSVLHFNKAVRPTTCEVSAKGKVNMKC